MSPRCARGRRTAASTRAVAVGTQSRKKSLQARFFAAASPASPALAGFPPPASRRREMASVPSLSDQLPRLLSCRRRYYTDTVYFSLNLFYYK
ncbi:MAG TPA: hypothetical protein P5215_02540 [Bacteroidales bacterium]|nr:hypothetical protein [Bacteroidales bacterium]